jgi:hypothetical protein
MKFRTSQLAPPACRYAESGDDLIACGSSRGGQRFTIDRIVAAQALVASLG